MKMKFILVDILVKLVAEFIGRTNLESAEGRLHVLRRFTKEGDKVRRNEVVHDVPTGSNGMRPSSPICKNVQNNLPNCDL